MTNRKSFEIFRHLWKKFEASYQIFWSDERDVTHFQKILRNIRLSGVTVTPQWRHSGITKAPQWRHKGRHNDNSLITMTSQWHLSIPKMLQRKIHEVIVASQAQLNDIIDVTFASLWFLVLRNLATVEFKTKFSHSKVLWLLVVLHGRSTHTKRTIQIIQPL